MKNSILGKVAGYLTPCLLAGLLLAGCQQEEPAPTPTTTVAGTFTGQELPEEIEQLSGTPLYSVSEELTGVAATEDACFLLIAPQDPTKALLVQEKGSKPADLASRESQTTDFSGTKTTKKSDALVTHVKERYELDLQVSESGDVVILNVEPPAATSSAETESAETEAGAEGE